MTASVLCAGLGYLLSGHAIHTASVTTRDQVGEYARELMWVTMVVVAVVLVVELRGVLPLR